MRFSTAALLICLACTMPLAGIAQSSEVPKPLWFVFLESGKKVPDDKEAVTAMQRKHIDNFKVLFGERKLFAAGPLRDPTGVKRGIVVVRANTNAEVQSYFQADDYVREGYMLAKAEAVRAAAELRSEGIDPNGIEEVRILQVTRAGGGDTAEQARKLEAVWQQLVSDRVIGAWYALETGPVAYALFSRLKNQDALEAAVSRHPVVQANSTGVSLWQQWIGKGVVP